MKTAFVFPGQGSQKVGMLQDLYNAYPIVKQRLKRLTKHLVIPSVNYASKVLIQSSLKQQIHKPANFDCIRSLL